MLIPLSTDAPTYHRPWVTFSVILLVIIVHANTLTLTDTQASEMILRHGDGLHPVAWLTSPFVDRYTPVVIANLMCFWILGLVVEGRLGWWRFLPLFFGFAVGLAAFEQWWMLDTSPFRKQGEIAASEGLTSTLWALSAIASVWAPRHTVHAMWPRYRYGYWDVVEVEAPIPYLAIAFAMLSLFAGMMFGVGIPPASVQWIAGAVGFTVGIALVQFRLVDCEGWDLISVLRDPTKKVHQHSLNLHAELAEAQRQTHRETAQTLAAQSERVADLITKGNWADAADTLLAYEQAGEPLRLSQALLTQLAGGLVEQNDVERAIPVLGLTLQRYPKSNPKLRIKLAELLIHHHQRPTLAIRVLQKLPETLSGPLAEARDALLRQAEDMRLEGVIEIAAEENW